VSLKKVNRFDECTLFLRRVFEGLLLEKITTLHFENNIRRELNYPTEIISQNDAAYTALNNTAFSKYFPVIEI
jgi:hypothetical protein